MNNNYIVIVGCGRLGSFLANQLSRSGNSVVVIDSDETMFNKLSYEFSGFRIEGDATQIDTLKSAKTGQADILIATTHEDNVNMMVAQVAKKIFNVPKVLTRVYDPKHEAILEGFGIEAICPTATAANMFLQSIYQPKDLEKVINK